MRCTLRIGGLLTFIIDTTITASLVNRSTQNNFEGLNDDPRGSQKTTAATNTTSGKERSEPEGAELVQVEKIL